MLTRHASFLYQRIQSEEIIPFIGIYDAFSALIAGKYYETLFVSGYGFAASYYGLPDIGFITWSDMVAFVQRLRLILPDHLLLVDIDDGYVDIQVACHVIRQLETCGVAGVILEDQKRPRRCGHLEGKQLLEPSTYLEKLEEVLRTREHLFVIARTDASDFEEILARTQAYAAAGADAILADGITSLDSLKQLKKNIDVPIVFNQIAGGKSPSCTLTELRKAGVSLVNYSTPCLFAAQAAIAREIERLVLEDGQLPPWGLAECNRILQQGLDPLHLYGGKKND